ncbi:YTH domain-containing protein ECT3-like isoform X2 [Hibiscus syriacus]|uniref:YTH domain-containing protein ECT3-like isoform X2 n=1 Tax=Hibiscus syriacus TaxID=106335 RepID=UPI001924D8C8|nr:YTH domain-containing protein ECT3-like isoform X2 [Hibiscus syriacus]
MATVEKAADSVESLSLNSQAKTKKVPEPVKKDFDSDNGSYMYPQTYGYVPYGVYSRPSSPLPPMGHDGQLHALQEYYYPSAYYQAPLQTSQTNTSQRDISTSDVSDQASLSNKNTGNLSTIASGGGLSGNNGSESLKSTSKGSSLNPNASYNRVGLPTGNLSQGYQDPRFSYDGIQSPIPWLDMSMSPNGQSEHAANGGFSSYTNNLSSGRNQNLHAFPHAMNMHNARPASGVGQAFGYMNHMYPNNMTYGYSNPIQGGSGFGSYGYDAQKKGLGWYNDGNNNKSRFRGYGKENIDGFNELNKGPRVKGYKNEDGSGTATLAVKDQNLPQTKSNDENIVPLVPDMEQYNKEDFPESYSDAKFFVIKSYSEDDVHKSIKYNVWASTSNGNKKLDAAFREAKKSDGCPVFLLFSVNTSGQFVGLAEMTGPVDFNKTVEYWQQDKWTGCFPVKWHIIKDVPNTSFRHIILKNNENKPVTNSRDTQEVNFEQGIQILKIFKEHSSKTCILDDFEFYENRQKIIQEKKVKHRLLQNQVLNGEPNDDAVTDNKETAAVAKETSERSTAASAANRDVKAAEENGSIAATEDGPVKPVCVASAC